jgi:adenosylcobinamide kinase/adenosylcobinamide-phosphate guanylyltransferase
VCSSDLSSSSALVLGGARSGKSRFALDLAGAAPGPRVYVATAEGRDDEMRARIARHREERGAAWETVEEPLELAARLPQLARRYPVILVDCLTLWVSNLLHADPGGAEARLGALVPALGACGGSRVVLVSNEVGMGIVPESALARSFRDLAGRLNQLVAGAAAEVHLVTAGIPLRLK